MQWKLIIGITFKLVAFHWATMMIVMHVVCHITIIETKIFTRMYIGFKVGDEPKKKCRRGKEIGPREGE